VDWRSLLNAESLGCRSRPVPASWASVKDIQTYDSFPWNAATRFFADY
jgi:hypothetical protein